MQRVLAVLAASALLLASRPPKPDPLPSFPRVILWAWERPEDLRFLSPDQAGVAFLARTIRFDGRRVYTRARLQPLLFAPGTPLMAVVRIESAGNGTPAFEPLLQELLAAVRGTAVRALQI